MIAGDRTTVDRIELSGADRARPQRRGHPPGGHRPHRHGRLFHDNENGILTGANPESDIVIERSRFFRNGYGDGDRHNLYVGAVRSLTVTGNWLARADTGHELKSRATRNTIVANRISDGDATASYSIDLPNGGLSLVAGNVVVQGPRSESPALVSYGAEGLTNPSRTLWVVNNTFVNQRTSGTYVALADGQPRPPAQQPPGLPRRALGRGGSRCAGQPPRRARRLGGFRRVRDSTYRLRRPRRSTAGSASSSRWRRPPAVRPPAGHARRTARRPAPTSAPSRCAERERRDGNESGEQQHGCRRPHRLSWRPVCRIRARPPLRSERTSMPTGCGRSGPGCSRRMVGVVGRARWGGGWDTQRSRCACTCFPGAADPRAGAALLLQSGHADFSSPGAPALPAYTIRLAPGWRGDPDASRAVRWRTEACSDQGLTRPLERRQYAWTPERAVPARSTRVAFRPGTDDEFIELSRQAARGSLDVETRQALEITDQLSQAQGDFEFYDSCPGERDWWRVATDTVGVPVGFIVPSATPYHRNVGYLGVLPDQRGRGLVDDLLGEVTRIHAASGAERITATTDLTNLPMAAAFERADYAVTEIRLILEAPR